MNNNKKRIAWNRGLKGFHSEEAKRRIAEATSKRNKNKKLDPVHKQRISASMKKIKQCDQCSIKSKWIYGVCIPSITSYTLWLCDDCLLDQYHSMKKVEVIS